MEQQGQEQTPTGPSASEYFNMVTGKAQPVASDQPAQEDTPIVDPPAVIQPEVPPVAQTDVISLDDTPVQVAPPVDDFDVKYQERLNSDFGFDKETLKSKLITPPSPTYKTEWAKLADEMEVGSKMSVTDFSTYIATDWTKLAETNPLDVLDFKMKLEMPSMTAENRNLILEDMYKTGEDRTEQEKALGEYKLQQDLKTALNEIGTRKSTLIENLRQPEVPQVDPAIEQQKAFWKAEAPKVAKMFEKLPVTLKITDPFDATKKEDLNLEIGLSAKDILATQAFVEASGASQGAKTPEEMVQIAQMMYWAQNGPKIVQKAIERSESLLNEKWAKRMANNKPPKETVTGDKPPVNGNSARAYAEKLGIKF